MRQGPDIPRICSRGTQWTPPAFQPTSCCRRNFAMYTNQNVFICPMLMLCGGLPRKFNLSNFRSGPRFARDNEIRFEFLEGAKRTTIWRSAWENAGRGGTDFSFPMGQDHSDYEVWETSSPFLRSPSPQLIGTTR